MGLLLFTTPYSLLHVNWNNVKLVFLREVRDQLRDRRTLFMVAVLPLLLYPALGLGMLQMTQLFSEQTRTVVVLGAADLPDPALIEDGRFVESFFEFPADADKLRVITDEAPAAADIDVAPDAVGEDFLRAAAGLRSLIDRMVQLEGEAGELDEKTQAAKLAELHVRIAALKKEIGDVMSQVGIQVLIIVPEGLKEYVARINTEAEGGGPVEDGEPPRLRIVRNSADEKSLVAYQRVKEAVANWEARLLEERLASRNLPPSFAEPVKPAQIDLAQEEQMAANVWSKLFPTLLIIMSVTGAFYPAVDLGAGEKERGTMETLLISPATRTEIVVGKFFTVLAFSMGTALLNLASMGFTGKHMLSIAGAGKLSQYGSAAFPPLSSLIWVIVLAVPLAALFSSLSLGLAMFARSSKEGQYYLTPLLMVTMGITVFCLSPAVEITPFYSILPVMGPALLLKALLLAGGTAASTYWYAIPVLLSSIGYCALGLWWAIEQFKREDILFREAEQFDVGLWVRHLLRDKEPTPSFTEAGFCFVLIMLLQFFAFRFLRTAGLDAGPAELMKLLIIQQLTIIATPALIMSAMLTSSLRQTLKLYWAPLRYFLAAVVLAFTLRPLTVELVTFLVEIEFLPTLDEHVAEQLAKMFDLEQAGWLAFLAFAIAPGICEELAFRGFILSGFSRGGRTGLAIVLSALAFGVMHLIPQQVFNASLLGLVLGLLVVRSGSLFPGILFHILYNGMEVIMQRVPSGFWTADWIQPFVTSEMINQQLSVRFDWPLLVICTLLAGFLLTWLIRMRAHTPAPMIDPLHDDSQLTPTSVSSVAGH